MRFRYLGAAVAVIAALIAVGQPASAARPSPAPQVVIGELTGPTPGYDGEPEWTLAVDAVDPDGAIWEVMTRWSDGEVSWANTFCLQGSEPGTSAHLLIPHSFQALGRYRVQVEATSVSTCAFDPSRTEQTSRLYTAVVTVQG